MEILKPSKTAEKPKGKGAGRPHKLPVNLAHYKDAIEIMMRHGTNIDLIAESVRVTFEELDKFLSEEGLYEKHKRRSWVMKTDKRRRRHKFADTQPRIRGEIRKISND